MKLNKHKLIYIWQQLKYLKIHSKRFLSQIILTLRITVKKTRQHSYQQQY